MSTFDEEVEHVSSKYARRKSLNPSEWKKNKEKVRRCSSDGRQPKLTCKHDDGRCQAIKLYLNDIKRFHSVFYSLKSNVEQDSFITNSVLVQKTARNRCKLDKKSREFTITYFVQSCNGDNIKVCCAMMCSILRIDPKRIQRLAAFYFKNGCVREETRGGKRKNPSKDHVRELVRDHIERFKCTSGHYGREDVTIL